jgi:hydroxymethylpyrimidine pyrophosphatase-like HAD family hydrolase
MEINKDLEWLHEYKVISTYEKMMLEEIKLISESLHDISKSLKIDILDINYSKGKYTTRLAQIINNKK